jgi:hypothetical protein
MYLWKPHLNFFPFLCGLRIRKAKKDPTCTEEPSYYPPAEVQHTDQLSKVLELTLHRVTHLLLPDSAPSQDGGALQAYSAEQPSEFEQMDRIRGLQSSALGSFGSHECDGVEGYVRDLTWFRYCLDY